MFSTSDSPSGRLCGPGAALPMPSRGWRGGHMLVIIATPRCSCLASPRSVVFCPGFVVFRLRVTRVDTAGRRGKRQFRFRYEHLPLDAAEREQMVSAHRQTAMGRRLLGCLEDGKPGYATDETSGSEQIQRDGYLNAHLMSKDARDIRCRHRRRRRRRRGRGRPPSPAGMAQFGTSRRVD